MELESLINWFKNWTKRKIKIHITNRNFYFRDREIWWAALGANIGFEQNGKNENYERPLLVFRKFGKDMLWGLPLTTKNKPGPFYYDLRPMGFGSSIILSQLKLISSKRLIRKIGLIPPAHFAQIRQNIKNLM